ncbi:hypothetical protein [Brevibacillus laterosporus]|uniref:hypothetical protein n=1 Tax=Brevibacillus laterosporus TaxID=1465 RepID=UPI0004CE763F|nr:hypothetical protein [Brevibacillus laterosporus]
MEYQFKTDWKPKETVKEGDMNRIESALKDAYRRLDQSELEINALKDSLLNDFKNNIFFVNFQDLSKMKVSAGWYDEANKRLVVL